MKIVIDMSDELYEGIKRRDGSLETEYVCDELMKAVDNGIILPKNHGRLIDADELIKDYGNPDIEILLKNIDTIIEADKDSE